MKKLFATRHNALLIFAACIMAAGIVPNVVLAKQAQSHEPVTPNGTLTIPSFKMPFPQTASKQAREEFVRRVKKSDSGLKYNGHNITEFRAHNAATFGETVAVERKMYNVNIKKGKISGITVVVVTPAGGVAPNHKHRVLINLHGGGFLFGSAETTGLIDSIALSSIDKIKIISVNYRMAPEYTFPAASEDVTKVYKVLLKQYGAQNIGIYGCSAGGMLTAQSVAWFIHKGLPVPGAIGTFCGSVARVGGDSAHLSGILNGVGPNRGMGSGGRMPYFQGVSDSNPLAFPGVSPKLLSKYPPTLLITGTRDFTMSSVIESDVKLTEAGVDSHLHVFDGMWHGFMGANPKLPETKQVWRITARFFDKYLGRQRPKSAK